MCYPQLKNDLQNAQEHVQTFAGDDILILLKKAFKQLCSYFCKMLNSCVYVDK